MGGTTFIDSAKAATAADAYRQLCERALHEYGHGGYTGSIAEKSGYVQFSMPDGFTPEELADVLVDWQPDAPPIRRDVLWERDVTITARERRQFSVPVGEDPTPPDGLLNGHLHDQALVSSGEWELIAEMDPPEWPVRQAEARAKVANLPAFQQMANIYDDKWGPALCVHYEDQWWFMGWAST